MLKIVFDSSRSTTGQTLHIEGRLAGAWVQELRWHCDRLLAETGRLTLDLAGLWFADAEGVGLLHSLVGRGVMLASPTPFIAAQLRG